MTPIMGLYKIRLAILAASLLSFTCAAIEPPQSALAPDQHGLTKLLSGNTLEGVWAGRPYRQYFSPTGSTRYREEGGSESSGSWRVDSSGQYCSVWPPSTRESCYQVLVEDKSIYWQSGEDYYASKVVQGNLF